ncbi:MAG TPA: dehydrogenase, partial [Caulobacteraceae bacterium]
MTPVATRALGRAAIVGLLCFGMASCATARRVWPFNRDTGPQATASAGERVSIIQFDQEIAPNAALAAAGFQLPAPRPVTSWSLPGGTPEQSIEHA